MSVRDIADILATLQEKQGFAPAMSYEEWQQERVKDYNNSTGDLNEVDGHNCDICKNRGYIARIDEKGYEVYRECKCQNVRATLRRALRSGLGNILSECTFEKFNDTEDWQKELKNKAKAFCVDEDAKWFYIGGQVGSGKSHICTAICGHYIKAGNEVKYMIWAEEAKKLKSLVNDEKYQDLIEQYKNVDVLYIDDFLKVKNGETPTAADINLAFEILNHRMIENSTTIISSEKMLDDVMEYDEATMSRIYQKAGKYKINIAEDRSKNYRLRGY